jgi:colicin import membrane protein
MRRLREELSAADAKGREADASAQLSAAAAAAAAKDFEAAVRTVVDLRAALSAAAAREVSTRRDCSLRALEVEDMRLQLASIRSAADAARRDADEQRREAAAALEAAAAARTEAKGQMELLFVKLSSARAEASAARGAVEKLATSLERKLTTFRSELEAARARELAAEESVFEAKRSEARAQTELRELSLRWEEASGGLQKLVAELRWEVEAAQEAAQLAEAVAQFSP